MKTLSRWMMSAGVASLIAGMASAGSAWAVADQDAQRRESRVRVGSGSGDGATTLEVNDNDRRYRIRMKDGKVTSATIDGKDVPPDRIVMDEKSIKLLDENGKVAFEAARLSGGGLAYGAGSAKTPAVYSAAVKRPMIGVTLSDVGDALAGQLGIDASKSVVISSVSEGMPAEKAGLKKHDVVVKIDGKADASADALSKAVRSRKPGDKITLGVLREGKPVDVEITVGEGSPTAVFEGYADDDGVRWFGQGEEARALAERMAREARAQAERARELGDRSRAWVEEFGDRLKIQVEEGGERVKELLDELRDAWDDVKESVAKDGADRVSELLAQLGEEMDRAGSRLMRVMPRVEFFQREGEGGPRALVAPAPPMPPTAPTPRGEFRWQGDDGARTRELETRIRALEERIDALLNRMEERGGGR